MHEHKVEYGFTDLRERLGTLVRYRRVRAGLTVDRLAEEAALPPTRIEQIERADPETPLDYGFRAAFVLGGSVADLVGSFR